MIATITDREAQHAIGVITLADLAQNASTRRSDPVVPTEVADTLRAITRPRAPIRAADGAAE